MNDVAIVGAGVLGVSLAYHLSRAGLSCVIVEKEATAAAHASGKNAGMIRQLYRNPQLTEWAARSIADMPVNLKELYFIQTGSLIVGRNVPDHHCDLFKQEQNAVRCQTDGLLDSGSYVQALLVLAKTKGTKCFFKHQVESIEKSNFWKITCSNKVTFQAQILVNASGAWLNDIANLPTKLKAKAYARHLAIVEGFPADYMPASDCGFYWDESEAWYVRKWGQTTRLVSVCDQVACDPESMPNSGEIKELIAKTLIRNLPEISNNLRIGNFWHCYRTYCEDRLPIIGPDLCDNSFFWLSGFGGFGMSTSYAATQDAARLILEKVCPNIENFSPARCTEY